MRARVLVTGCSVLLAGVIVSAASSGLVGSARSASAPVRPARSWPWVPNGSVNALLADDGTVYVGGEFSRFGAPSGSFVVFRDGAVTPDPTVTKFQDGGTVDAIVGDGSGGWFVGGSFPSVAGVHCAYLVHVLASGKVNPNWCPRPRGYVETLFRSGRTLYVGGGFDRIAGAARSNLAALDASSGRVLPFHVRLGISKEIYPVHIWALAGTPRLLFLGGGFASVDGRVAKRLAAVDASTGRLIWRAEVNSRVTRLALEHGRLFIGGWFTRINGKARAAVAAVDLATGRLLSWQARAKVKPSCDLEALVASPAAVYLSGRQCGGITTISTTSGKRLWHIGRDAESLSLAGRDLVAADGSGGEVGVLDAVTGRTLRWGVSPNGFVLSVAAVGSRVAVGGIFGSVGGVTRVGLAALDASTGRPTAWKVDAPGGVSGMALVGETLYVAGGFTRIENAPRGGIAAIDLKTGGLSAWAPPVHLSSNYPAPIAATTTAVYVAGATPDDSVWAFDASTGARLGSWNPDPDEFARALAASASTVYLGGDFTHLHGSDHPYLAAVDPVTGIPTDWQPRPDGTISAIALQGTTLYVGGAFNHIGGSKRHHLAAFDTTTGRLLPWDPGTHTQTSGSVTAIVASGLTVYVSLWFQDGSGAVEAIDSGSGTVRDWSPTVPRIPNTIAVTPTAVYVGGEFGLWLDSFAPPR